MLLGCSRPLAEDWPQWRGPNRDGTTVETAWSHLWRGEPKRVWKAAVGVGFSSIAVANGLVYTQGQTGSSNVLWCLDAESGAVRWQHGHPENIQAHQFEGGPTSTPLVADGKVYVASRSGLVQCLDAGSGGLIWKQSLKELTGLKARNWGLNSSPLLAEGKLLFNWGTAGVALNPKGGQLVWLTGNEECSYTSLVPGSWHNQPVVFVAAPNQLAAVGLSDGKIGWSKEFHSGFKASDPVLIGDKVFFGANETGGILLGFGEGAPRVIWENPNLGTFTGGATVVDGFLYGILSNKNDKGELACVDPKTGEVRWRQTGYGWGSLLAAGDRLLALSVKGELSVVRASPAKLEVLARAQILGGKCWTTPSLANGRLYARNGRGDLVCFDLRPNKI